MATQLVTKRCDFGSLGVPGPASTPKPTNQPTDHFFHHHQPCVAIMCLTQGPIWPIFSSSSAMCGQNVSQFGLICFILIRFSKQWFYLGEPPHPPAHPPPAPHTCQGVLAGPGTPRDPKSHLFVTNWVAIRPFFTFLAEE